MKKYSKKEIIIIGLSILAFVFGFIILTGTFNSSYHLVDDHEFVRIIKDLQHGSLIDVLFSWVKTSFTIRFRPLYFVLRVLYAALFGLDFKLWYTWKALEICLSAFFLYFFARNLKCNKFISILFPALTLIGAQIAIWFRLGPQEATGLLFLSIALFYISDYCFYNKSKKSMIIIISSIFLTSLMKESFVLMIPPIVLLKLSFDAYNNKKIKDIIKENMWFVMFFAVLFCIEIFIIVFAIGVNKLGYAGFSGDTTTYQYLDGIKKNLLSDGIIQPMILMLLSIGIIFASYYKIPSKNKKTFWGIIGFVFSIIILQLLLHAKSTMFERYIVPMSVAYSFMIIIVSSKFLHDKKTLISYFGLIILTLIFLLNLGIGSAKMFAKNGNNINNYLSYSINNSNRNDKIIILMDYELAYSTFWYLKNYNFNNVYRYLEGLNSFTNKETDEELDLENALKDVKTVIVSFIYHNKPFEEFGLNLSEYSEKKFGDYIVYIKK